MRKRYLSVIFLLSIAYSVMLAQMNYGLTAGFVVANSHVTNRLKGDDSRVFYPIASYNINGYIGYKSNGCWGLSFEPGYIQKGGLQKDIYSYSSGITYKGDITYRLHYIQLPILVNLYLTDKLYVSIGPEVSYMLSAKGKLEGFSLDISDSYDHKFELSGMAGINYTIAKRFDIGVRYNHGLTKVSTIQWRDLMQSYMGESNVYNQYFQLIVRVKL